MEFELKKLSAEAIPQALERAERYRLLNEPRRRAFASISLQSSHIISSRWSYCYWRYQSSLEKTSLKSSIAHGPYFRSSAMNISVPTIKGFF
jgi:hypothetical protein